MTNQNSPSAPNQAEKLQLIRLQAKKLKSSLDRLTVADMMKLVGDVGPAYDMVRFMRALTRITESRK